MADIKSCGTCEYKMTGSFESPCKECCENRNPYTMWEAIPLPPTTATDLEGEVKELVWSELKDFKKKFDAARSKNEMLRKYLGYIRNKYSYREIFIAMEKAGFETPICEGIHKIMFYDVDDLDNWNFIDSVLKEKEQEILSRL